MISAALAFLLVSLVYALSVYSITKALELLDRGNPYTGLGYLIAGVSGIFGGLIVGLPLVFGGF